MVSSSTKRIRSMASHIHPFSSNEKLFHSISLSIWPPSTNYVCVIKGVVGDGCHVVCGCLAEFFVEKHFHRRRHIHNILAVFILCAHSGSPLLRSCAIRIDTTPHVSMERNRLAIMKEHTLPADRLQFSVNCCRGNSIWLNIASHVDRNGKAKLSGEKNDIFSHFICPFAHKIARPIILILCSFEAFSAVTHLRKSSFTSDNRHQRSQRIC